MKPVSGIYSAPRPHWVGDGFPVHSMFDYSGLGKLLSPFLLLDYAAPTRFEPNTGAPRGVGEHPHRGFETVTIVYDGEVEHRDSTGQGGVIGPGDVQWMTAAGGILHQEFHSAAYSRAGGPFEMVQLWVNLPAKDKMSAPGYQAIMNADIPAVALADGAGTVRVIAGQYAGHTGPAHTFTPMQVWDVRLNAGKGTAFELPDGWTTALVVLRGNVRVNGDTAAREAQLVVLERAGAAVLVEADTDAKLLLLAGEPIAEPIVGYGPFVMNSQAEISQAMQDFRSGRFGRIAR
ncbi:putative Quercetin 2,3-dioxygenase [Candidatus Competibacter denitrificans Run_A_D11]|uniref:Quercetin 2,3-dioxygenase n=1 Tax=Candidatus Competibacter denitrificans Run_A_D11 TaxID=1400863 RepID=W6MBP3_9GAMM|nr:pirin family protein [Candidatus Competibacter denitrificans]CDI04429.1 putative Quercetin 2,3-dioxygenase [Candidatus Competibacter denitrificans Run_A_D11]HAS87679.1 pirin family protein [Candidatus Competibacteraceae bacterium]HRC69442.1 pirin family protein [Candidatus Competibacter denitrificans]